ncbi:hypothetical protein TrVE_jg4885 [Triparma verrucosa]|uniref:Translation initiation factor IF-3 n=1 Tax=Triparma verrucosa TaxID=1606542 RepID=A0A9W7DLK3_9STRA|nr:hypothetical protein TrVE_jg4885 [Triparma verrucosa]
MVPSNLTSIQIRYRGTSTPTGRGIPANTGSKKGKPGSVKKAQPQRGGGDAKRNARARTVPQSKRNEMGRKGSQKETEAGSEAKREGEGGAYDDLDESFFDLDVPLKKETGGGGGAVKKAVPRPAKSGGGKKPVRLTREQQARAERSKAGSTKPLMNKGLVQMLGKKKIAEVRLVVESYSLDEKNESRVCSLEEAIAVARDEMDVDLVLVTPAEKVGAAGMQVVVKAVDWGRMEYEKKKKEKSAKKAALDSGGKKPTKTKEIKFGAAVEQGDFNRKIEQLIKHLTKGHSVKVTIMAKKREMNLNPTCVKDLQISVFDRLEKYVTKDSSRKLPGFAQFRYQVVFTPKANIAEIISKEETLKRIAEEEGLSEELMKTKINL